MSILKAREGTEIRSLTVTNSISVSNNQIM